MKNYRAVVVIRANVEVSGETEADAHKQVGDIVNTALGGYFSGIRIQQSVLFEENEIASIEAAQNEQQ